jgi:hypothetical protein
MSAGRKSKVAYFYDSKCALGYVLALLSACVRILGNTTS